MPAETTSFATLESGLLRANARVPEVLAAIAKQRRVDLGGLAPGALAYVLGKSPRPALVLTADLESARRMASSLGFFAGEGDDAADQDDPASVLLYPSSETSPYLDVAPDRRASMDRLACLFHLAQELPLRFIVAPIAAAIRRAPPKFAIAGRSRVVKAEDELDRDELVRILVEGGYLRVPVAEDPGTFAIRGGIIDVYPPHSAYPARIELDDYLVMSIKLFDPDDQRTVREVTQFFVHPVREALLGPSELALARERVRALCDAVDMPTSKTRQLLDDIESGRNFYGIDGFLPAYYQRLDTLFDYLPQSADVVVVDPTAVARAARETIEAATVDHDARAAEKAPVYEVAAHFATEDELAQRITSRTAVIAHRLAVAGEPDDAPLAILEAVDDERVLRLGSEDHAGLVAELKAARARDAKEHALEPVAKRAQHFLDQGLRVVLTARTRTQAERLASLMRGYGVKSDLVETAKTGPGRAEIAIGSLADGFVLASEGIAYLTEEEIFGSRAHKKRDASKKKKKSLEGFSFDLRELKVGDFVVHVDHGIGRYLGLERKTIAQSAGERLRGEKPISVEVLLVEYAAGDRLFLPITRLHQIQKLAGQEGHTPKLDRLGGSTFAKTKARVRKEVRQLADDLLKLYAQRAAAHRPSLPDAGRAYSEFEATFPFEETPDQARAIEDVISDLDGSKPMDRLVCGDVGFGKTEVALRAAFRVAMAGRQVAFLCPTTVLAHQHVSTFKDRLRDYPIRVESLSRFVDKKRQTEILGGLKDGKVDVVIGTHRLLSKDVHFKELGLLVIDEEQRFGVSHKERIKSLRGDVDVLTLTATPIPRTLQMAVGGLRDLSLITTPPVDRRAVRTVVSRFDDHVLRDAIAREIGRGGQIFFVYNRIEGLYEKARHLQELFPTARIAVAHGQMTEGALEQTMTDFVDGEYDILASTAIIESGIDIPRANTILIDRADIFGLAQLYQLRGRVGRSRERAYCYLFTTPPSQLTDEARFRIEALERFSELGAGFQVASLDMQLRGAGDILGAEQSGNVAMVGFELFCHMLEEAVAELRGEPTVHEVDTELTLDVEHFLPDDYIEDVGIRLSFYKRFANAESEEAVADLASEMEDRFGAAPPAAACFVRAMRLRPELRSYRVLGCEASKDRVTLHLREDTTLDPQKVMALVARPRSPFKLTPDMKLVRRFDDDQGDAIDRIETLLRDIAPLRKDA